MYAFKLVKLRYAKMRILVQSKKNIDLDSGVRGYIILLFV